MIGIEFVEIAESKEIIYIGNDLPDEYTGSNYTAKLKGTLVKAKANATQGIPEIIEIAENKRFRENLAKRHDKMPGLDGIGMILVLPFRFLMTMVRFCVIMCSMWRLS